jgi:transposase
MGTGQNPIAPAYGSDGTQTERSSANAQRHPLAVAHRSPVAGSARAIRSLENGVPLLLLLARRPHVRTRPRSAADTSGSSWADRLGLVVHRRLVCPGLSGLGGRFKKSGERHNDEPPDHALGRSKGGFGSKFHLVTDSAGLPLAVEVTGGQQHESTQLETVLDHIGIPQPLGRRRQRPRRLAGDKAYSVRRIRDWLAAHGIRAVIPRKSNERYQTPNFDRQSYRRRAVIEQCVGWLKECRRIGTRFEKLAVSFLAMFRVAMIQRYLKLTSSDRA